MLDSVRAQTMGRWEHCIVDDGSSASHVRPILEDAARRDSRIRLTLRRQQGGIVAATNDAAATANGEFIAFLDHDDELHPNAVESVCRALASEPDVDYVYTDEDKIDAGGLHSDPFLKPDWSPERLRAQMYTCHWNVVRRELFERIGRLREGFDGSQDWDLILRVTEHARRIIHVPEVLYHWRAISSSVSADAMAKPYAHPAGRRAIQEHLGRIGMQAEVVEYEGLPGHNRIRPALDAEPLVSIIIPSAARAREIHGLRTNLLVNTVRSIVECSTYPRYEIAIVLDVHAPDVVGELREIGGGRVRIVPFDRPFNYSAKINVGAVHAAGEYFLTLNDDVEVLARGWPERPIGVPQKSDWIESMLSYATLRDIGSVGAKMYFGDRRLQHVGIVSTSGSAPVQPYHGFPGGYVGYFGNAIMPCNYLALTGACLMTRRDVFEEVGGLSAPFPNNYQDVDFGLKLHARGYRNVFNPEVELFHFEGSSRETKVLSTELDLLRARWGRILAHDPYYHPGFVEGYADFVHPHYTAEGRFVTRAA
jgi:GT2 family glycosyltransferase